MKFSVALVCLAVMAFLPACGNRSDDGSLAKIVGGTNVSDHSTNVARQATVALASASSLSQGKVFCSATLIDTNILLTAAHCVTDQNGAIRPEPFFVVFAVKVSPSAPRAIARVVAVDAAYDPNIIDTQDPTRNPMNDLALVRFEGRLPASYSPVDVVDKSAPLAVGRTLTLAGFGVTATRWNNDSGSLRQVDVSIEGVGNPGRLLILKGPKVGLVALVPNGSGGYHKTPGTGGSCAGDSGGPAYFKTAANKWVLAGVTSYGSDYQVLGQTEGELYCLGKSVDVDLRHYSARIEAARLALRRYPLTHGFVGQHFSDRGLVK